MLEQTARKATGNNEVAKMVAEFGKKYTGIEDAVTGSVKKVKEATGDAMKTAAKLPAKGIAKAGMKISQTKIYKRFSNFFAGRITKGIVNKIKSRKADRGKYPERCVYAGTCSQ